MNIKIFGIAIALSIHVMTLYAQQDNDSFNSYRNKLLQRYTNQRQDMLTSYADYFKKIWKEYQSFQGMKSDEIPKPLKQPQINEYDKNEKTIILQPEILYIEKPKENIPTIVQPISSKASDQTFQITFYDLNIDLPVIKDITSLSSSTSQEVGAYWEKLEKKNIGSNFLSGVRAVTLTYCFNDWLEFDLVRHGVNESLKTMDTKTRIVVSHYLLTRLGYDIRLGITATQQWVLLLPFQQIIYGRTFIRLHDKRYYIYYDDIDGHEEISPTISTCEIPKSIYSGKDLNLVFERSLVLPEQPAHKFMITNGHLSINGSISKTLIKMVARYPQMPIPYYATSILQQDLRNQIVEQLKQQTSELNELDAVNALLSFVQHAFQYATDDQQFGYEKPFFMEELLYYPQCDCEDRAVFYAYLLQNVLGLDCHLLNFPGHESVAVKLSHPIGGAGYTYKGEYYYISDPTYIDATTGMCMPIYQNEQPKIEF